MNGEKRRILRALSPVALAIAAGVLSQGVVPTPLTPVGRVEAGHQTCTPPAPQIVYVPVPGEPVIVTVTETVFVQPPPIEFIDNGCCDCAF